MSGQGRRVDYSSMPTDMEMTYQPAEPLNITSVTFDFQKTVVGFGVEGQRFWEEDRISLALEYFVSSKDDDHKGQGWYRQHPNVVFNSSVLASSSCPLQ